MLDSTGYESDSEGYESDSEGYQSQKGGNLDVLRTSAWDAEADPKMREIVDGEARSRGQEWKDKCIERWQYFADLADAAYGDRVLAVFLCADGVLETDEWPRRKPVSAPALPRVRPPHRGEHSRDAVIYQVNMRLRETDYLRLAEIASRYGLPPTTLARLFVARGVEAAFQDPAETT